MCNYIPTHYIGLGNRFVSRSFDTIRNSIPFLVLLIFKIIRSIPKKKNEIIRSCLVLFLPYNKMRLV